MATKIVTKNSSTAGAAPTATDLVQGELAVNVADGRLYTEDNAAAIVELGVNPATEITANAGIALPDSQKATFGAGDDLQIYHNGSNSYIQDHGTGDLVIAGTNLSLRNFSTDELFLDGAANGAVRLWYNGAAKLATTSTGIDVTGTATMDGLTVDGNIESLGTFILNNGTDKWQNLFSTNDLIIRNNHNTSWYNRLRISYDGDISFYEDTGTTPKFFWDSSAESLGIGTSSPDSPLEIQAATNSSSDTTYLKLYNAGENVGHIDFENGNGSLARITGTKEGAGASANDGILTFSTAFDTTLSERMRIDSSGNVGIGTSSPNTNLHIQSASEPAITLFHTGIMASQIGLDSTGSLTFGIDGSTGATERMRIDSSGNLLVGKTGAGTNTAGAQVDSNGRGNFTVDANFGLLVNRKTSDGELARFQKDGTTVGSIGAVASNININSLSTGRLSSVGVQRLLWDADQLYPATDNVYNLGFPSFRFDDIYATNATIQTSDRNEKQDIAELNTAETAVAVACKGLLRKFRWKDSVAEKGDEARTHFGIIAQDLQAAFEAEGLDAGDYAMFMSDTWTDEETNEEKTRMGVRYSELLAFIIAAL